MEIFMSDKTAYRGAIFYFKDTATIENLPDNKKEKQSEQECQYVYIEDGILVVEAGKIVDVGSYDVLKNKIDGVKLVDYKNKIITPGFIDTHQHATQSAIVAAYGEKLLEWLEDYVFPAESVYSDRASATKDLNFFLDYLLRNGTTTAVSYGPLFYEATDIFFAELQKRNMRFVTGNILMDENAPDKLRLTTQENYDNCVRLIEKWHNKGRLSYCISPRFALACSEQMLELCGSLKKAHPDCYIQTHLDENLNEIAAVKKIYPWSKHYLDVYDHFGLVTDRSVFGHCIHTTDEELELFKKSGAIISWCPLSNNFLGSGLFNFARAFRYTNKITLGTDWGAGNCLSMFAVLDDAYKVSMLNSVKLPSMMRWYMATLGAAKALQLDDKIGTFKPGKEADFIVIDPDATTYLKYRRERVNDIFELLFILMALGSEDNIKATYIMGKPAYIGGC
ncbi:guanine deaminase [Legionella qingyii]|uniref:Guanine deaminase n=2 Tax=Legionella qingyii TaxID=2184757 RepID=A0A317U1G8_9GAMM|nr:guanine deaminase [Legionella qingyii]RUR25497.1 guanine deaminase [Legionella qingyii]RUR28393.1 guanine deaminase [Legionella qingyii]